MTYRPILFSAPMVRAVLEGRKTVTRRVLKVDQPFAGGIAGGVTSDGGFAIYPDFLGGPGGVFGKAPCLRGDTLWVREAWRAHTEWDGSPPRDIPPGSPVQYMADGPVSVWYSRYRHARFMPRWASRITLRVTGVTVERLQDITEEQAIAEGINQIHHGDGWYCFHAFRDDPHHKNWNFPDDAFRELWNDINGPDAWDQNPWVAAISFERVKP